MTDHAPAFEDFRAGYEAGKPQIVAASKMDAVTDEAQVAPLEARARELGLPFFRISAVTGAGLDGLLEAAWTILAAARRAQGAGGPPGADPAMLASNE